MGVKPEFFDRYEVFVKEAHWSKASIVTGDGGIGGLSGREIVEVEGVESYSIWDIEADEAALPRIEAAGQADVLTAMMGLAERNGVWIRGIDEIAGKYGLRAPGAVTYPYETVLADGRMLSDAIRTMEADGWSLEIIPQSYQPQDIEFTKEAGDVRLIVCGGQCDAGAELCAAQWAFRWYLEDVSTSSTIIWCGELERDPWNWATPEDALGDMGESIASGCDGVIGGMPKERQRMLCGTLGVDYVGMDGARTGEAATPLESGRKGEVLDADNESPADAKENDDGKMERWVVDSGSGDLVDSWGTARAGLHDTEDSRHRTADEHAHGTGNARSTYSDRDGRRLDNKIDEARTAAGELGRQRVVACMSQDPSR